VCGRPPPHPLYFSHFLALKISEEIRGLGQRGRLSRGDSPPKLTSFALAHNVSVDILQFDLDTRRATRRRRRSGAQLVLLQTVGGSGWLVCEWATTDGKTEHADPARTAMLDA